MFVSPGAEAKHGRWQAVEGELAELCGMANAVHGRMVELVGEALDEDLWSGYQIHSPGHWLGWKTSMTGASVNAVVALATRRHELPLTTAALAQGSLSLAQASVIARHVPGSWEESVMDFAPQATVAQLQRTLPKYGFTPDPNPNPEPDPDPQPDGTPPSDKPPRLDPISEGREWGMGNNDDGSWWFRGRLPADEGAVLAGAIRAARDDLYRQALEGLPDGAPRPVVTMADALLATAEGSLRAGEARYPGSDRYRIYAHLQAGIDPGGPDLLSLHLGPLLPEHLRRLHTCDATIRPVWEREGTPVNVGRDQRIVPRRIRRLIEHRDQGCAVPGCHLTTGLECHHIVHWEDGGPTDTSNLVTLCRRHHRLHHLKALQIWGNPDQPGTAEALTFANHHGTILGSTGQPVVPSAASHTSGDLRPAARAIGVDVPAYVNPSGERLNPWWVTFQQNENWTPPGTGPEGSHGPDTPLPAVDPPRSWPPHTPSAQPTGNPARQPNPTRAGPEAA
ncbi:MAG: DUF222 domain-containing protein [Aquihabitans sp.]